MIQTRDRYSPEDEIPAINPEKRKPVPVDFYIELEDSRKKQKAIKILSDLFNDYSHFKNVDENDNRQEGVHIKFDDVPNEVGYAGDLTPKIIEALENKRIKIRAKDGKPEIYIAYPKDK